MISCLVYLCTLTTETTMMVSGGVLTKVSFTRISVSLINTLSIIFVALLNREWSTKHCCSVLDANQVPRFGQNIMTTKATSLGHIL